MLRPARRARRLERLPDGTGQGDQGRRPGRDDARVYVCRGGAGDGQPLERQRQSYRGAYGKAS